jgi:hypothetical protein
MKLVKHLPRFIAAALFAASTASAVVVTGATQAGQPANGVLSAAPQAASAAVSVGIGIGVGGPRYYRYAYRGGSWVRIGFAYGTPGYVGGYYIGYGPPVVGYYPYGYARPYYYGPYARAYYGPGYYGRGYYGHGYYGGRGYYGHGGYGYRR